jgi:hypothetical protein
MEESESLIDIEEGGICGAAGTTTLSASSSLTQSRRASPTRPSYIIDSGLDDSTYGIRISRHDSLVAVAKNDRNARVQQHHVRYKMPMIVDRMDCCARP